jgi:hypothetical protein
MNTVRIQSALACIIVLSGISINPLENVLTEAEFEKLLKCNDFKVLRNNGKITVVEGGDAIENFSGDEPSEDDKDYRKMKISDLRAYAESMGIEIPEGSKKEDIVNLVELALKV